MRHIPKASFIATSNRLTFSSPGVVTPKFLTSVLPSFISAPQPLPVRLRPLFRRNKSLALARRWARSHTCPLSRHSAKESILALTYFLLAQFSTKCPRAHFHFPVALPARSSMPSCTRRRFHPCA